MAAQFCACLRWRCAMWRVARSAAGWVSPCVPGRVSGGRLPVARLRPSNNARPSPDDCAVACCSRRWASAETFSDVGLSSEVANALALSGFYEPTGVQAAAIADVLAGRHTIVTAETGSGKTLVYAAPVVQDVFDRWQASGAPPPVTVRRGGAGEPDRISGTGDAGDSEVEGIGKAELLRPSILILVPTRELVVQVSGVLDDLLRPLGLGGTVAEVYGKLGPSPAVSTTVLVATPHALASNVRPSFMDDIRMIVLDEKDILLSGADRDTVVSMLSKLKMRFGGKHDHNQHVFVGATLPSRGKKSVGAWLDRFYADAARHTSASAHAAMPNVQYLFKEIEAETSTEEIDSAFLASMDVEEREAMEQTRAAQLAWARKAALLRALREASVGSPPVDDAAPSKRVIVGKNTSSPRDPSLTSDTVCRTLVFVNSLASAIDATSFLKQASPKLRVEGLHKRVPESRRKEVVDAFIGDRDAGGGDAAPVDVLVATDVAARGLDTVTVDHVVQFEFSTDAVTFLHRSGRTGRMGRPGVVTSIYETDNDLARAIWEAIREGDSLDTAFSRRRSFRRNKKKGANRGDQDSEDT